MLGLEGGGGKRGWKAILKMPTDKKLLLKNEIWQRIPFFEMGMCVYTEKCNI